MSTVAAVGSPCMKVCTLDASGTICLGCLRTANEIAEWTLLSSEERARVVGSLPERHRLLEGHGEALELFRCPRCGTDFGCGADGPKGACWCNRYPPVTPKAGDTCLCPACLAAAAS